MRGGAQRLTARSAVGVVAIWRLAGERQANANYQHEQSTKFSHSLLLEKEFATKKDLIIINT